MLGKKLKRTFITSAMLDLFSRMTAKLSSCPSVRKRWLRIAVVVIGVLVLLAAHGNEISTVAPRHAAPVVEPTGFEPPIRVGVVSFARPSLNEPVLNSTLHALRERFGSGSVVSRSYTLDELINAINNRDVDIFLSSAGFFWRTVPLGTTALAALASIDYPNPNKAEASAFVVRADSDMHEIADLHHKTASVATKSGFASYLIAMRQIQKEGFDYETFFKKLYVTGPGKPSAHAMELLADGQTDVAVLRQCWLEEWLEEHPEAVGHYRVLATDDSSEPIGVCKRSTALYPSWVVASAADTSPELSKAVVEAVFSMSITPSGHYWSIATDFASVDELYKDLQLGPYQSLRHWSLARFLDHYSEAACLIVLLALGWVIHEVHLARCVRRRTQQLRMALDQAKELKRIAARTNERYVRLHRMGIVGQISTMIASQLSQPVGALSLYLKSARRLLDTGAVDPVPFAGILDKLDEQVARVNAIIEDVRGYNKNHSDARETINLRMLVEQTVLGWRGTGRSPEVLVQSQTDEDVWFEANALQWEIVILNLIKNAAEACRGVEHPLVIVRLSRVKDDLVQLSVTDNGPNLSQSEWNKLEHPEASGPASAMGMGLAIVRGILHSHGATLHFERNRIRGITAIVDIELAGNNDDGADQAQG